MTLRDLDHNSVQQGLSTCLRGYAREYDIKATVDIEHYIDIADVPHTTRADVTFETDNAPDCAFEVKTRLNKNTLTQGMRQLMGASYGGFKPVLVVPEWEVEELSRERHSLLEWGTELLLATVIDISNSDPLQFRIRTDRFYHPNQHMGEFFANLIGPSDFDRSYSN